MKKGTDHRFTPEIVEQCTAILREDSMGALGKWNKIKKILEAANIITKRSLRISQVFVSPRNRGGTGINAYNVHRLLSLMIEAGVDLELLRKATCFEVNPSAGHLQIPPPHWAAFTFFASSRLDARAGIHAKYEPVVSAGSAPQWSAAASKETLTLGV